MKNVLLTCCALLTIPCVWAAADELVNLAPKAKVSATSEYDANYAARFAVDEKLPEAFSQRDSRRAWAINRAKGEE